MSRLSALCISATLAVLAQWTQAATLVASVDRSRLNSGETVELTLETNDVTQFGKPDLTPLEGPFEVRDTRQVNRLTSLDGDHQATTRWIITLLPRQTGSVTIAPLQLGELRSQPILLQVLHSDQPPRANMAPVFIDATLDGDSVYVQAQAVLTVRIYHSVPLYDDSNLTPLQLADARVEPLGGSRTFEKIINGVRHGVIETRYAIYPQRSGEVSIPALVFTATTVEPAAPGESGNNAPQPGKQIRVTSAPISLTVNGVPGAYPADVPWLPARSLSLTESWNPDPPSSQVGDSLTRTLEVKAEGLSSAQLPDLPDTQVEGLRRYPDQPQLSNRTDERGLTGSRQEREALVPARSGTLQLPSVEVVWWNTHEDHLERTALPARSLEVAGNAGLMVDAPVGNGDAEPDVAWPWKLASVMLLFTTMIGFALWWRARGQPAVLRTAQSGPSPRTLLDDLKRACQANDPQATRQALDAWARQQPETLADMAARFVPLSDALDGLNGALYSESGQYWQGEELWRAIGSILRSGPALDPAADNAGLPPLYPK
ncbi:BatD family protein [Pseudomonas coleopterorum]|jgi:hypothetical protein|uniref:Protein BatD n=1 Tax=Pseudomonas coleopterorum TaxID=1605838 RepID=A0ABR9BTY1_9PSED|nr:BatD family protein [Pseudomonas coleopterorum]MBD8754473.1 protein BatD [Pseudomonas coleopterorum]MBD8768531.1 protein BatD [Pseudomonas coleopterorum]